MSNSIFSFTNLEHWKNIVDQCKHEKTTSFIDYTFTRSGTMCVDCNVILKITDSNCTHSISMNLETLLQNITIEYICVKCGMNFIRQNNRFIEYNQLRPDL
jgi:hypothetical protein